VVVVVVDLPWIITMLQHPAHWCTMLILEMVLEEEGVDMGLHGLRRH
jgi:hypothetical protein